MSDKWDELKEKVKGLVASADNSVNVCMEEKIENMLYLNLGSTAAFELVLNIMTWLEAKEGETLK